MATKISWCDEVWNPFTGCAKVSAGCQHCYAERLSHRFGWTELPWTASNLIANLRFNEKALDKPLHWRKSRFVFVNSMSDFFLQAGDTYLWRERAYEIMYKTPQHVYLVLTKRPSVAVSAFPYPPNLWIGTSIEDRKTLYRIEQLALVDCAQRFISFEPLIGDIGRLDLAGIDWVIVGGESGPGHRTMDHAWARSIRDQCVDQGVKFWFKQSASLRPGALDQLIEADGSARTWQERPER